MRRVFAAVLCVAVLLFFSTAADAQMTYGAVGVGPYGAFAPGAGFGPYGAVGYGPGVGFGGFGPYGGLGYGGLGYGGLGFGGLGYGGFGPGFGSGFGGYGYGPFNYSQQLFQQQSSLTQQIFQQRQVSLLNQIGVAQNDLARLDNAKQQLFRQYLNMSDSDKATVRAQLANDYLKLDPYGRAAWRRDAVVQHIIGPDLPRLDGLLPAPR